MSEEKLRVNRVKAKIKLNKLPNKLKNLDVKSLGLVISDFIHHV